MGFAIDADNITRGLSIAVARERNQGARALAKASEQATPILWNIPGAVALQAMVDRVKEAMGEPVKEIPEEALKP